MSLQEKDEPTEDFSADFNLDDDDDDGPADGSHKKLLSAVSQLYNKKRVEAPKRSEPAVQVSEFHLSSSRADTDDRKRGRVVVNDLAHALNNRPIHREVTDRIKTLRVKCKTLPKPLEKIHADKAARSVGFKNLREKLTRWDAVIQRNRASDQLRYPLVKVDNVVNVDDDADFLSTFSKPTELELQVASILKGSAVIQQEKKAEQDLLYPLSIEEMVEKRKMMAQIRAQESYRIAKAARQNKIKSKKYHRILRQEKMKEELKTFESLKEKDPEAALEKLQQLERARAEERATLRHRNTGQWAKTRSIRAKYDKQARIELAEQLAKSRELTQKLKLNNSSSDEDEEDDDGGGGGGGREENGGGNVVAAAAAKNDNPWVDGSAPPVEGAEIKEFVSAFKNFCEQKKKKEMDDRAKEERERLPPMKRPPGREGDEEDSDQRHQLSNGKEKEFSLDDIEDVEEEEGSNQKIGEPVEDDTEGEDKLCEDNGKPEVGEMENKVDSKEEEMPKCSKKEETPKCSKKEEMPKYSKEEEMPKCSKKEEMPKCSKEEEMPKCSKEEEMPKCSKEEEMPKCSKEDEMPKYSKKEEMLKCSKKEEMPKYSKEEEMPKSPVRVNIVESSEENGGYSSVEAGIEKRESQKEVISRVEEGDEANAANSLNEVGKGREEEETIVKERKEETASKLSPRKGKRMKGGDGSEAGKRKSPKVGGLSGVSDGAARSTPKTDVVKSAGNLFVVASCGEDGSRPTDTAGKGNSTPTGSGRKRTRRRRRYSSCNFQEEVLNLSGKWTVTPTRGGTDADCREAGAETPAPKNTRKRKLSKSVDTDENSEKKADCAKSIDDIFKSVEYAMKKAAGRKIDSLKAEMEEARAGGELKKKRAKRHREEKTDEGEDFTFHDLSLKGSSRLRSQIDDAMIEMADGISNRPAVDLNRLLAVAEHSDESKSKREEEEAVAANGDAIDPHKFLNVKPKRLNTQIPEMVTGGDERVEDDDDDEDDATNRKMNLAEAFADDDVVDQFRKEKEEEIKESEPAVIDLSLPGWGSWGGTSVAPAPAHSKRKRRRFITKIPQQKRSDRNKGHVIITDRGNEKIRQHMVSDLPANFTSVKEFEASVRAPIGTTWVPQLAHARMSAPPVVTKMGAVIEPMDENQLADYDATKNVIKADIESRPPPNKPAVKSTKDGK